MEISFRLRSGVDKTLKLIHLNNIPEEIDLYNFVDAKGGGKVYLKLELKENQFIVVFKDIEIDEEENILKSKLEELLLQIDPIEASLGTEQSELDEEIEDTPYDPEKIRVDTKQLSLRQVYDMIKVDDIDLTPDFQRNLVWNDLRQSRLIESILLRIPLPIFYFAQDEDGKISVVDGLQRLSTIRRFMDNEFRLNNLEYLQEKCGGKYYTNSDSTKAIDAKYFRWLNMTQITVNIIDPSSPFKLKYDIFRRINTGGQPLNAQEIRNCLASKGLRKALREMAHMGSFKYATGFSVKDVRMEAQELALRFILFHRKYQIDSTLSNYSGNIDLELNALTDELSKDKVADYTSYVSMFDDAMKNAYHLFGNHSFRKSKVEHLEPNARRQLINKALFVSWSVLLSQFQFKTIIEKNKSKSLIFPLAERITYDTDLFQKLTWGTNAKLNHQVAFKAAEEIIINNLKT